MGKNELQYGVVTLSGSVDSLGELKRRVTRQFPELGQMEWKLDEMISSSMMMLSVRRFNLGNLGNDAVAILQFPSIGYIDWRDIQKWGRAALDVLDPAPGNVVVEARDLHETSSIIEDAMVSRPQSEPTSARPKPGKPQRTMRDVWRKARESFFPGMACSIAEESDEYLSGNITAEPQTLERQEDELLAKYDKEQQQAIEEIQAAIIRYVTTFHADPKELLLQLQGKIIVDNQPSPLVVNKDMDIVLSHYDEITVEMPALIKSVYILFLLHPEGIVLKNFGDYRTQLEEIYGIVMPNRDVQLARESIDNLCDPLSNTLNEYIAKIKKSFKRYIVNDKLLDEYRITGRRGQPYGIALSRDLVTLPAIFA